MDNYKNFQVYLNTLRQKGDLAYEYNPFHNYQTEKTLYLVDDAFIVPEKCIVNIKNGEIFNLKSEHEWIDKKGKVVTEILDPYSSEIPVPYIFEQDYYKKAESGTLYAQAGSIIDLDTEYLNFDLKHPVDILVQPSYDGSVNLILNDDKNIPRLINSRFSPREKGTYEIVDRIGENDTNIYSSEHFNNDSSLYLQYTRIPTITFEQLVSGQFPVGQYCFYITYCDSDNNESDIVSESHLIPMFIGGKGVPFSMEGGIKNELSNKGVLLKISNLDTSYNYIKIKYIRYFADYLQNRVYEGKEIILKYEISNYLNFWVTINGYEETLNFDPNIVNLSKFNPKSVLTQAQCKNMLFLGNISKITDNYKELSDISLRIVPKFIKSTLSQPNNKYYGSEGYYDPKNMYYNVGYFNQEFYSFGIVYIYNNGTLSNVYPTLGYIMEGEEISLPSIYDQKQSNLAVLIRKYLEIDNEGWIKDEELSLYSTKYLNSKGVCLINSSSYNKDDIFSIEFNIPEEVIRYLKETLQISGYFFVRRKRIPNIIALCYLLPYDEVLQAPVLETLDREGKKKYFTECFVSLQKTTTERWEAPQLLKNITGRSYIENTITTFVGRKVTHNYDVRLYEYSSGWDPNISHGYVGICPDFLLNQPYYNLIFNSLDFRILQITENAYLSRDGRFWIENSENTHITNALSNTVTICSVTEDVPSVVIKDKTFKLKKGQEKESVRFLYVEKNTGEYNAGSGDTSTATNATNISRGMYSPYLAIYSTNKLKTGELYNIYSTTLINTLLEFSNRMKSNDPYYAISDRHEFKIKDTKELCFRGDCYLNTFTYRLNRNFNDPSLANNDVIIDENTWIDNYDATDSENWGNIIRSDLNSVKMGSWITFKCRSPYNYALRSVDHSYVSEEALMGSPRSFYPKSSLLERGENKLPDSYLYNDAYRATLGYKCYYALQDINYIKDTFSNRILYSAVSIQDSFKNNYRESLSTYFRDYSLEYGSILKLIGFEGHLLVVLEHAIGIAVVNERVLAGTGDGEPVFINTKNVLPEELTIITDTYGTLWPESVIKTETGAVYGVDTIAKKIWRVQGKQLEIISDFRVNKFLIDNISLGERERYPIIGLKNVKTHYNNNKKDVMFTFYDDVYLDEEKVWNLCFNELLNQFITFYSWVPSYSENIDTQYFSFDRNTSKWLSLLNYCNYSIPENTGVLLDSPVCRDTADLIELPNIYYCITKDSLLKVPYTIINLDGTTNIEYLDLNSKESGKEGLYELDFSNSGSNMAFRLEKDHWKNYELFKIEKWGYWRLNSNNKYGYESECPSLFSPSFTFLNYKLNFSDKNLNIEEFKKLFENRKCLLLNITPYVENLSNITTETTSGTCFNTLTVAITLKSIVENPLLTNSEKKRPGLTTDFYLHGLAGIFNISENLYPTHWYGEFHPFEFEFVVNDKIGLLKIFYNLEIISNKAEPESFHFEIEGDNYDFSPDKRAMYFRQEATKEIFLNLGSDMLFDRKYKDVAAKNYTYELYYRGNPIKQEGDSKYLSTDYTNQYFKRDRVYPVEGYGLVLLIKSSIFPLYYERIDTYNDIYHIYRGMLDGNPDTGYDFKNLSGSEILWDRRLNQFNIVTHIKNSPINLYGRLRGNSFYKEGKWFVQIPSIIFNLKNEDPWGTSGSYFILDYSKLDHNIPLCTSNNIEGNSVVIPPLVLNSNNIPKDLKALEVTPETLPSIYRNYYTENEPQEGGFYLTIDTETWTGRKEARIRDKWIKIRVRYSGKNLAIIHSIITLFNVSPS